MTGRVLVTGATGSLGSALARHLIDAGEDVTALVPPGAGLGGLAGCQGRFRVHRGDVTDQESLRAAVTGVAEIYHLAGEATLLNRLAKRMWLVNVLGARAMAQAAAAARVRRFVHTSSVSAIGYPPDGEIADESFDFTRTVTRNAYLTTKRAGEDAVLAVGARTGLEVVVVNPAGVIAPHSHLRHGWAALVERARRGQLAGWPPGGAAVCAADELVAGQLAAMHLGRPGQRYILATANLTYRELFCLVCAALGQPPPRVAVPAAVVRAASWAGAAWALTVRAPLRSPFLVPENAELAVRHLYYDPSKARRELGVPRGDLARSIRDTRDWLRGEDRHAVPAH